MSPWPTYKLNWAERETVPLWWAAMPEPDWRNAPSIEDAQRVREFFRVARAASSLWQCVGNRSQGPGCGMVNKIEATEAIQTHHYVSPHGCTGGDYWVPGEVQIVCPSCSRRNRLYTEASKAAFNEVPRGAWAKVTDEHKD